MVNDDLVAFASDPTACPDADALRAQVLTVLDGVAAYDGAIFLPLGRGGIAGSPVARKKPPAQVAHHRPYALDPMRYIDWARRSRAIAGAQRGAYRDTEVFSSGYRDRSLFYTEIVRPQGISRQIVAAVTFRGARTGSIHLERYGRGPDFSDQELEAVRDLLPVVALSQAALQGPSATGDPRVSTDREQLRSLFCGLSTRERQLVEHVMRGLSNREIAMLCGTSVNTVRNQISRIFEKLGASNRTELTSWATRVADRADDFVLFADALRPREAGLHRS